MKSKILILLFFISNGVSAQYWQPLGNGISGEQYVVWTLATDTFDDILYVGGSFDSASGVAARNLAVWNGAEWKHLPITPENEIRTMTMKHDTLIYFSSVSNDSQIGMYVDTSFVGLLPDAGGGIYCSFVLNDTLYIGGDFEGGVKFWNGNSWAVLGGGVTGQYYEVDALGSYNGQLIVGGEFDQAGSITANNIASWYGNQWHTLGNGLTFPNYYVYVLAVQEYNGELYAGGDFDYADSIFAKGMAPIGIVYQEFRIVPAAPMLCILMIA